MRYLPCIAYKPATRWKLASYHWPVLEVCPSPAVPLSFVLVKFCSAVYSTPVAGRHFFPACSTCDMCWGRQCGLVPSYWLWTVKTVKGWAYGPSRDWGLRRWWMKRHLCCELRCWGCHGISTTAVRCSAVEKIIQLLQACAVDEKAASEAAAEARG